MSDVDGPAEPVAAVSCLQRVAENTAVTSDLVNLPDSGSLAGGVSGLVLQRSLDNSRNDLRPLRRQ